MPEINLWEVLRSVYSDVGKDVDSDLIILNDVNVAGKVNARIGSDLLGAVRKEERITLDFPRSVLVVTPDFLMSMFGGSLNEVTSLEMFRRIFYIDANTEVCVQISFAIEAILKQRKSVS